MPEKAIEALRHWHDQLAALIALSELWVRYG